MNKLELNKELHIFVTNVEVEEDIYLKIWGQLDRNAVRCVENILNSLEEYFVASRGLVGLSAVNLHNSLCCAKFKNVGYCRARIINIHSDGMVVLRLIDYGTIEVLKPVDVHLLENILGSECLHSYPPLAYDFTLMDILPINMAWDKKIVETIRNTLWQNEHKIVTHSVMHNYRFIKVQYHNEDFGELLVKRHMALAATIPEMLRVQGKHQIPLYQHPNKRAASNICSPMAPTQNVVMSPTNNDGNGFQQNLNTYCAIQQKHLSQPPPIQEALVFKSRVLDVGSKHEVYVSFVEDGPHKFSVQVESTRQDLSSLMRDMNKHPVEPLQEPPIPGLVCMGRYTRDKVLCRAVVMSIAENKCKLYYVDFGHTEVLPYTDIYQLPPHYINPKVLSIRFTLSGVKELNVTEEMKEYFKSIVSSKLLMLHVRPPEGPPLVQYGDLYDNGKNIKDILRQAFPSPTQPTVASLPIYQESRTLSKGIQEYVYVSFVESHNKFFVQLDNSVKALESVMDCLAEYCKTAPTINQVQMRPGFPCAALYESQWYRAQILSVTGDKIRVLYIDYGNEETVNIMSLRLIHDDLVRKLQAQAIRCILNGWEMLPHHKDTSVQFESLTLEKRFLMKVVDVHLNGAVVDLYDPENMDDIKTHLIKNVSDTKSVTTSLTYQAEERSYTPKISNNQVSPSNTTNEWQKKSPPDSWNSPDDNVYIQEKPNTKSLKDELNEERRYDTKTDKGNTYRSDTRNDRFNRDGSQYNTRSSRDKWNNKFEQNDSPPFNKGGRSPRGGKSRMPGSSFKQNHSSASEKSFSDKDSDVSSRGSSRRGRGNSSRGGYSRRDGGSSDMQNNKWNDRDSDGGGFRSARGNSDSYSGNKYKERRGQGYRISRNKMADSGFFKGTSDGEYGNDFHSSSGSGLGGAKEETRNYGRTGSWKAVTQYNYAPLSSKWTVSTLDLGSKNNVIITWFINPNNFFCQILEKENEFRTMMNEIQKMYVGRDSVSSHELQTGSAVIALFPDDGALYRAEVVEPNKPGGHLVQYIDFGNTSVVPSQKMYAVETKLMDLPKQAVQCSLKDVAPLKGTTWAKISTKEIDNCFNADKYECTFHDIEDNKYIVMLSDNGTDVASVLVDKNLATFIEEPPIAVEKVTETPESKPIMTNDVPRIDITLLSGQTLRVKVSSVENDSKFYIQLPSAVESENIINTYMSNNDPKVMQRLSTREMCLGTGCLICTNEVWRRAVITDRSKSAGFHVKLIDTGANDEILSDSILALPGELAVMQNQAIECILQNTSPSSASDKKLKDIVEGKDVMLYIDEVDNNRLITTLFDTKGNKIALSSEADEKIFPICPMPVLTSTHKVSVSFADHSASVWLQRCSEYELDSGLAQALQQHYANSGKTILPQIGGICAAKSADGNWYRGKVINCSETSALVNFIDYGNNEEINLDSLVELDPQFYTPHQLTINVSLPVTLNCSETEQLNILQTHLSNKELTAVFNNVNKKWVAELIYEGEKISEKFRQINMELPETSVSKSPAEIQNIEVGCTYDVYVSHMDSPSQFWVQCADEADDLAKKQDELQSEASTFPAVTGILEEATLCIAVYSFDNMWYRAQVLDADEDITTVRFIDYGNTDVIDNKTESIKYMTDKWKEIKKYAARCRLDVVPVDSEDWSEEVCTKFQNLVNSADSVQALIIADGSPKRVDLVINGRSVSETLMEEKCAIMMTNEEALIDEIVDIELDPHSAFVSHINSPKEFWVQEEKSVGDLEIMSDRFIVADMFPKVDEIKEGMLCVAKYPEDRQWYRARIIACDDNSIQVLYIDYGNSAVSTEIRAIPEDLASVPALSRKCSLVTPDGISSWSERACDEFIKLSADGATIFLLDVLKDEETSMVKLTLNGQNVADILGQFCERYPITTEERLPPLGEENLPNVLICRVNTLEEFFVQSRDDLTGLDLLADRLKDASSFPPLTNFEVGSICAAKFVEDDLWYRAKILSHSKSDVEVLFIDYGNSDVTTEIRILPEDIAKISPLARRCILQKPDEIDIWAPEALDKFIELANDDTVMYQLEILDANDPSLVKLSLHGQNICNILISHCENVSSLSENRNDEEAEIISENMIECSSPCVEEEKNEEFKNDESNTVTQDNYEEATTSDEFIQPVEEKNEENNLENENSDEYQPCIEPDSDSVHGNSSQVKGNDDSFNPDESNYMDSQSTNDYSSNNVKELTVDEIVQNMERNVDGNAGEQEVMHTDTNFEYAPDPEKLDDIGSIDDQIESRSSDEQVENVEKEVTTDETIISDATQSFDDQVTTEQEKDIPCKTPSTTITQQCDAETHEETLAREAVPEVTDTREVVPEVIDTREAVSEVTDAQEAVTDVEPSDANKQSTSEIYSETDVPQAPVPSIAEAHAKPCEKEFAEQNTENAIQNLSDQNQSLETAKDESTVLKAETPKEDTSEEGHSVVPEINSESLKESS